MRQALLTLYTHVNEVQYRLYSGTVCLQAYKHQGSLAVGMILAS